MPLTKDEREGFLAAPHIGSLSVAVSGQGPLVVPIWYSYEPGGEVLILTGAESRKIRHIREAGRFSLLAHQEQPTTRYVSVEGPVTGISPISDDQHRAMAARYLPPPMVDAFMRTVVYLGEQVAVTMRPERWLSADIPLSDQ